jgi:hypothetical protein
LKKAAKTSQKTTRQDMQPRHKQTSWA